ncbi:hypothetical protein JCM3775_001214 [Rhodotorula graminis]
MAAPTGRRDLVPRDGKDKATLVSAGRLMSRRTDREVEALKVTVAQLEEQLAAAKAQGSAEAVNQALARTDGGLAAKALRKEVDTLEKERDIAGSTPTSIPPSASSPSPDLDRVTNELAASQYHRTSLEKQVVELERRVKQAQNEVKLRGPGAGPGLAAAEREGLKEEVRIAQYEVEMLAQEKTKLAAQVKLERAQRKQAEDDAELEGQRLKDRLSSSAQRVHALEGELARARAVANGVKGDQRHFEAQLRAREEAWELRVKDIIRETDAKFARLRLEADAAVRNAQIAHAAVEQSLREENEGAQCELENM